MKRLVLGIAAAGFLIFVGAQAIHAHTGAVHNDCQLCVLGAQSARHVPAAAPEPVNVCVSVQLAEKPVTQPLFPHHSEISARGPPAA